MIEVGDCELRLLVLVDERREVIDDRGALGHVGQQRLLDDGGEAVGVDGATLAVSVEDISDHFFGVPVGVQ